MNETQCAGSAGVGETEKSIIRGTWKYQQRVRTKRYKQN